MKKRSELMRFGIFVLLLGLIVWFVTGRVDLWRSSEAEVVKEAAPVSSPLVTASPVSKDSVPAGEAQRPATASSLDLSDGRDYFAEYRIDRERTRGALGERLKELMESQSAAEEVRKQASQEYLLLSQTAAKESRAEAMVKARGFDDVIVHLTEGTAQVVVKARSLTQQQVVQIIDTVSRTTGVKSSAVTVLAKYR